LVAFGVEDYVAARADARGGSWESGASEGEVEKAALAGAHGVEGVGLAGAADLLDGGFGGEAELLLAEELEVLGVEGGAVVVLVLEAEDLGGDVLDGKEEFAVAGGEQGGVRAGAFDGDVGGGVGGDRRSLTGRFAGVALHLAVAGKYVELQVQTAGFRERPKEVLDFF